MIKLLWQRLGTVAFWAAYPALIVYLSREERTRLLLRSGNKIVVVRGWLGTGKWSLPGGGLHRGEDSLPGVLREVFEETGLRLSPLQVAPLFRELYRHKGIRFTCHYFVAELPEPAPLKAQFLEIVDLAWVDYRDLTAKNAGPDVLSALQHLPKSD